MEPLTTVRTGMEMKVDLYLRKPNRGLGFSQLHIALESMLVCSFMAVLSAVRSTDESSQP